MLESAGCTFYREGKGDHRLYIRYAEGRKRVVPIDMGAREFSPPYVLRIFRRAVQISRIYYVYPLKLLAFWTSFGRL